MNYVPDPKVFLCPRRKALHPDSKKMLDKEALETSTSSAIVCNYLYNVRERVSATGIPKIVPRLGIMKIHKMSRCFVVSDVPNHEDNSYNLFFVEGNVASMFDAPSLNLKWYIPNSTWVSFRGRLDQMDKLAR